MANLTAARSPEGCRIVCQFVWGANSSGSVDPLFAPVHRPVRRVPAGGIAKSERGSEYPERPNVHEQEWSEQTTTAIRQRPQGDSQMTRARQLPPSARPGAPDGPHEFVDGDGVSGMIRDREDRGQRSGCSDADASGLRGNRVIAPAAQTATSPRDTVGRGFRFVKREIS